MLRTTMDAWASATTVTDLLAQLQHAADVQALLARAAERARRDLPFDRAVVLTVDGGHLTARDCGAIAHDPSDHLRRRVLARPVEILPRSIEAGAVGWASAEPRRSSLAEALGLGAVAVGVIAPEGRALALVVVERDGPEPDHEERTGVEGFAAVVAAALEHVILRERLHDLSGELRNLAVSAQALTAELRNAPAQLPSQRSATPSFAWDVVEPTDPGVGVLSAREIEIMERLVAGRSNREIAAELVLAPDTVKGHVARILRKLGAANRVEAVTRYLAARGGR